MKKKMWGGRFKKATDPLVEEFTHSIAIDKRLAKYDVLGSIAHTKMLIQCGIISKNNGKRLVKGLSQLLEEIESGTFRYNPRAEDIHTNIEDALKKKVGGIADTLHTARSRNDQVALDLRMYCKDEIKEVIKSMQSFLNSLSKFSQKAKDVVMPGYTHTQQAQTVYMSQYIDAYSEMLRRDIARLKDAYKRTNVMPLGACALAGTSLPIDRDFVAKELGFVRVAKNTIDAVSDRDFVIELTGAVAILFMHLSRFAEDLILFSTLEFGFIELDDAFCTGSSIMPQKKNPDVLELTRAKTARAYANLMSELTMMKALPLAYNRDMQEDKPPLFNSIDQVKLTLKVLSGLVKTTRINRENLKKALQDETILATDLAEYLVRKGISFREAHAKVGRLVSYCLENKKRLSEISISKLKRFSMAFGPDVYKILDVSLSAKNKRR